MKSIIKYPMLFLFGGSIYYLLEIIFRGYSFPAMVVCGGLCFVICGAINEKNRCMPLVLQQLIASAGITAIEFLFGLVLNVWLGLHMWDYSNMPGNILGQICPQFTALWFFLSALGIFLDDYIRWVFFGEEKPHYHLSRRRKREEKENDKATDYSKLWSAIYDLVFLVKGTPTKSLEEIEADLDIVEYACRKYADCDDDEITFESRGGTAYADTSAAEKVD